MTVFRYQGTSQSGKIVGGSMSAKDPIELGSRLLREGIQLDRFTASPAPWKSWWLGQLARRHLSRSTRHLSDLLLSRVSLIDSLSFIEEQSKQGTWKSVWQEVRHSVEQGQSLSDALSLYPSVFDEGYVAMARVGEQSGQIGETFSQLATAIEARETLRQEIKKAIAYPLVVCIAAIIVIAILMVFVIPSFHELYSNMGIELPPLTQSFIEISSWITEHWLAFGIGALLLAFVVAILGRLPIVGITLGKFVFNVPVIGKALKTSVSARYATAMSDLLSGGLELTASLAIAPKVCGVRYAAQRLSNIIQPIVEGQSYSKVLSHSGVVVDLLPRLVHVGEETGELAAAFSQARQSLLRDIEHNTKLLTTLLEPLILIVMGLTVGVLLVALYSPLFTLTFSN